MEQLEVLYKDKDVIVVIKPEGVLSQSNRSLDYDMLNRVKNELSKEENGDCEAYLVHRLDRPVGGIMVFARNKKAAASLGKQLQDKTFRKKYLAVVTTKQSVEITKEPILLEHMMRRDGKTNTSQIVEGKTKAPADAKKAKLTYQVLESREERALLEVVLYTGRHHQIRVQLSTVEAFGGIYGDTKYNPDFRQRKGWFQMGLFSYYLEFEHPTTKEKLCFEKLPKREPYTDFSYINEK
ncbi:MAG: RNA pseudouridine synthase [Lachnospiraceae bacterium]|nr:RNA pseudouridine synthase [Lachnospiraceae bacterium]